MAICDEIGNMKWRDVKRKTKGKFYLGFHQVRLLYSLLKFSIVYFLYCGVAIVASSDPQLMSESQAYNTLVAQNLL